MSNERKERWKEVLFSKTLARKGKAHKIAYIAVMTALAVVANMFFEFKLAETQFSFTIVVSVLTGVLLGPLFGLAACFIGDLVGFLYHSAGFMYMPWIGLSIGLTAFIAGLVMNGINENGKPWLFYIKLAFVCVITFLLCTVLINTTAFWLLYAKVDYWTYLVSRLLVQGQIWNSLVNYALLFIIVPMLSKIKLFKIS
jgi:ECF transporter S component (folate family)